jgi:hypothetical protein
MASLLDTLLAVPSLFTMAKNFRENPVVGSRTLHRWGLHRMRCILADRIHKFRQACLAHLVPAADREEYRRNGFIVKKDYLTPGHFADVANEVLNFDSPGWECHQGDTITHRILLDEETLERLPAVRRMVEDPGFRGLMKWTGGWNVMPLLYIQRIHNAALPGEPDPQKVLHSDTFHPTMKAWFFVRDVPLSDGPFTYVPGTNQMTPRRLDWEDRRVSEILDGFSDVLSERGSLRVLADKGDPEALGIPATGTPMAVPANTLVVADTHGFHARGQADGAVTRVEIWAYSRGNPFNPLVGYENGWIRRIRHAVVRRWIRWQHNQAVREGRPPMWHYTDKVRF